MKTIFVGLVIVGILVCAGWIYCVNRPEYLAAESDRIPDFFELPSDDFYTCIDEIHSQGRKFEDFGSAHYDLRIKDNSNIRESMRHQNNVIETDTTLVLKHRRGDIEGTFVLHKNSQDANVHYIQIYDD